MSDFRIETACRNGLQRVVQRVKCLIINVCNAATAVLGGGGGYLLKTPPPTLLLGGLSSASLMMRER
jgi:hypothetical protein